MISNCYHLMPQNAIILSLTLDLNQENKITKAKIKSDMIISLRNITLAPCPKVLGFINNG